MKKIFILLLVVVSISVKAQLNNTDTDYLTTFTLKKFTHTFTGENRDTISATRTLNAPYFVNFGTGYLFDFHVKIDTVSGTVVDTIKIQGRKWLTQDWETLQTKVISITGADTNIYFEQNDTTQFNDYIRVLMTGGTGTSKINTVESTLRIW